MNFEDLSFTESFHTTWFILNTFKEACNTDIQGWTFPHHMVHFKPKMKCTSSRCSTPASFHTTWFILNKESLKDAYNFSDMFPHHMVHFKPITSSHFCSPYITTCFHTTWFILNCFSIHQEPYFNNIFLVSTPHGSF